MSNNDIEKQKKPVVHFNLTDGFYDNEEIEIVLENKLGRKKIFSGKLEREGQLNVFVCDIVWNKVNTFELYAKDRKQSISYSIIIKNSDIATIDVSVSEVGFHVMFSDRALVYY